MELLKVVGLSVLVVLVLVAACLGGLVVAALEWAAWGGEISDRSRRW